MSTTATAVPYVIGASGVFASLWIVVANKSGFCRKKDSTRPSHDIADNLGEPEEPGKELAVPAEPEPVYELYGHPAPPIPLLGAALPQAPLGYGWEITAVPGVNGNPQLRLVLLDLKTGAEMEFIEADLVVARRWKFANDETYQQFYRRAERDSSVCGDDSQTIQERMGKVMMANLITPIVDWATVLTLRYIVSSPDETKTNYMLVQNIDGTVVERVPA